MSYLCISLGNRTFLINQVWIEILVYGTSYYLMHWFLLKFLVNDSSDSWSDNKSRKNHNNKKFSKKNLKHNTRGNINIIRGGDGQDSIDKDFLELILKKCFKTGRNYKVTSLDLETKIRKFIEVAENSGIKVVLTSVAILSILHETSNFVVFMRNYGLAIIRGVVMATDVVTVISPIGRKVIQSIATKALQPILNQLPTSLLKKIGELILVRHIAFAAGTGTLLLPIVPQIAEEIVEGVKIISHTKRLYTLDCSDYVKELQADYLQPKVQYVESYEKPDRRVIIKTDSEHIICLPEKSRIRTHVITIPMLDTKVIVGKRSRIETIGAYKSYYSPYQDKIPKVQDFRDKVTFDKVDEAKKLAEKYGLLNEEDFNKK